MAVRPARRLFTVDEYHRMGEAGILSEDDRIELIDGEIVEMTPIGPVHAASVTELMRMFIEGLAGRAVVTPQNPVILTDISEPQPDVCLLRLRDDRYFGGLPRPSDVLLLVEVSDSSLAYDRGLKLTRYALAGVPEVWIVDVNSRRIEVFREPSGDGYRTHASYERGKVVAPQAFEDVRIDVSAVVP